MQLNLVLVNFWKLEKFCTATYLDVPSQGIFPQFLQVSSCLLGVEDVEVHLQEQIYTAKLEPFPKASKN